MSGRTNPCRGASSGKHKYKLAWRDVANCINPGCNMQWFGVRGKLKVVTTDSRTYLDLQRLPHNGFKIRVFDRKTKEVIF